VAEGIAEAAGNLNKGADVERVPGGEPVQRFRFVVYAECAAMTCFGRMLRRREEQLTATN
jgi:hypothetical protein